MPELDADKLSYVSCSHVTTPFYVVHHEAIEPPFLPLFFHFMSCLQSLRRSLILKQIEHCNTFTRSFYNHLPFFLYLILFKCYFVFRISILVNKLFIQPWQSTLLLRSDDRKLVTQFSIICIQPQNAAVLQIDVKKYLFLYISRRRDAAKRERNFAFETKRKMGLDGTEETQGEVDA